MAQMSDSSKSEDVQRNTVKLGSVRTLCVVNRMVDNSQKCER